MFEQEYQIACEAALKAGEVIAKYYGQKVDVEHKSADQPVTIADREANECIFNIIQKHFPDDGWLSEETADSEDRLAKERVWIVDPLDGTKEFINEISEFAVSIALVVKGRPVVGVIYNPATKELFSAYQKGGAFLNDKRISVSSQNNLSAAKVLASRSELKRGEWQKFEGQFVIQPSGGMAYKMVKVACGDADASFSLTPKNEWDFVAGDLIVHEAGGKVVQLNGQPFLYNKKNPLADGILYAAPSLFGAIIGLIGPIGPIRPIIFFDGVCGLCNRFVDFVLKRDTTGVFVFAPLQGQTAEKFLSGHQLTSLETMVLYSGAQVFERSQAVLQIVSRLPGLWKMAAIFKIVPRFLADWVYGCIARSRYQWFGKSDTCRLPSAAEKSRFLD